MLFFNYLCQSTNEGERLKTISDTILEVVLAEECNCTIDEAHFVCATGSPTHVTYRARLVGTSEIDSEHLMSLIQEWARNGTNLSVDNEVVEVEEDCRVAISSPSQEMCTEMNRNKSIDSITETSDSAHNDIIGIIGGSMAALLVAGVLTAIAIAGLIFKFRSRKKRTLVITKQ